MDTYTSSEQGLYGGIRDFCGNQHPVLIKTEIYYINVKYLNPWYYWNAVFSAIYFGFSCLFFLVYLERGISTIALLYIRGFLVETTSFHFAAKCELIGRFSIYSWLDVGSVVWSACRNFVDARKYHFHAPIERLFLQDRKSIQCWFGGNQNANFCLHDFSFYHFWRRES